MTGNQSWHLRFRDWLEHRIGLSSISALAKKKDVPVHRHTIWYYLGGMSLFLFICQLVSGTLLLFYYRPSAGEAFESVHFIMAEVQFGWLVRSLHAWAANLMVFTVFIHLFSVFLLKAYRAPRDLTWMSGVVLLVLTLGFGFTGYLLPWNELAYLRYQGRNRDRRRRAPRGRVLPEPAARRHGRDRCHVDPLLRDPRGHSARRHDPPGGTARAPGAATRNEHPPGRGKGRIDPRQR